MLLLWFNQRVSYLSIFHTMNNNSIMIPFSLLCSFNSWLVDATVMIQSACKLPLHTFMQWTLNSIMIPFSLLCSLNSWLVDATVLIQSDGKLPQHYFIQWTLTPSWSLSLCYVCLTHGLWMLLLWFNQRVSYLSIFHTMNNNSIMIPFSLLCSFNSWLVDATVLIQSGGKLPQHISYNEH